MLLLSLFLFCGLFAALTYGIELILPPFGKLYFKDLLDILHSLSMTLSVKTAIPLKTCFILTVLIISIIPFIITLFLNLRLKKLRKKPSKYILK